MKKIVFFFAVITLFCSHIIAQTFAPSGDAAIVNSYSSAFSHAYEMHPDIPKGMLEAVAFTNTRFQHLDPSNQAAACTGLPAAYGVMGLMEDGKNVFKNTVKLVADLSGYSTSDIKTNPEINILAYAKAFSKIKNDLSIISTDVESHLAVLAALNEIPSADLTGNFALNSNLYTMFWFLDNAGFQSAFSFPARTVDFVKIFGEENYRVLSSGYVAVTDQIIQNKKGDVFTVASLGPDYGPAIWDPAASCNYSVGRAGAVTAVAIHFMQGTYGSTLYWFKDCASNVSTQYVMRSSDGQISQMVLESNTAQHVATENYYTIGIEHEGYIESTSWYTTAMYNSSAALVKDICKSGYGISPLSAYYGPGCSGNVNQCLVDQCIRIKGHQMFPNGGHTDPGPYWDWKRYYLLLNDNPVITKLTTAAGTLYDTGGPTGNYINQERPMTLISPAGATKITLTFKSFNLEANADHLFIYDGSTTSAPLIGKYTGTTSPGTVTSSGGSLLIEFRSDCSQAFAGWEADWTSIGADAIPPTTQIAAPAGWITQDFSVSFADADNAGGSGLNKSLYHVVEFDGASWTANPSRGFFRDNFDNGAFSYWNTVSGSWGIGTGYLSQSDETITNGNIYAPLTQNLSNRYLYHWSGKIEGTGTNRRAGIHFFSDDPQATDRGNSYLVWFRPDQGIIEFYKSVNNVLGSPVHSVTATINTATWYDFKISYDKSTGKIEVYLDNSLAGTWTDTSPLTNGSGFSFRTGNCSYSVNSFYVYRSRGSSVTVNVGPAATDDIRYQNPDPSQNAGMIKSIVVDNAGNFSTIATQSLAIDWTPPAAITKVEDGTAADIDVTNDATKLSANWSAGSDPNSGIAKYFYAIGTSPGATNIINWTDNGTKTTVTKTGLSLVIGTTYYFTIKAENGAGLQSAVINSDGQKLEITTALPDPKALSVLSAFPNPFSGEINIQFSVKGEEPVVITLADVLGKVRVIKDESTIAQGINNLVMDKNTLGLSAGVYFLQLQQGNSTQVIKLICK